MRAALEETSIRLVTMGTSSADTSPWRPGQHSTDHPPGARQPWQTPKGRSSHYRKEFPPGAEGPGRYSTRTWWRCDLEVLPAASVASTTYEKVPRSQAPADVFPDQATRWRPAARVPVIRTRTTVVLAGR